MCQCFCEKQRTDRDIENYDFLLFEYNKFPSMARETLLPDLAKIMRQINSKIVEKDPRYSRASHASRRNPSEQNRIHADRSESAAVVASSKKGRIYDEKSLLEND